MTRDEELARKFVIRKVRKGRGYANEWQVAFPGPLEEPLQAVRVPTWDAAVFITIAGLGYIERHDWERFRKKVLKIHD